MTLNLAGWTQKTLASAPAQFTKSDPVEVEPTVQFYGTVTIRAPHTNPAGSSSRSLLTVLFEDESGAVVDNEHPRAGDVSWSWTSGVGRWYRYVDTGGYSSTIAVPQGLRLSLVGLHGWDDTSTARTVESLTVEGSAFTGAQVALYARPDGSLATVGEARVWDGRWKTVYESWKPRIVTIATGWELWEDIVSGDATLVAGIATINGPRFTAPVVADKDLRNYPAGTVIPVGVTPSSPPNRAYNTVVTFTEVRP